MEGERTIGILLHECNLLTEVLRTRGGVTTTCLGVERLAAVGAKVVSERAEGVVDVVRHTLSVRTTSMASYVSQQISGTRKVALRVVRIKIFVDIKDEVGDTSIGVRHLAQSVCGTVGDKGLSRGPVVTRKQDELSGGAGGNMRLRCIYL